MSHQMFEKCFALAVVAFVLVCLVFNIHSQAASGESTQSATVHIIPQPVSIAARSGDVEVTAATRILVPPDRPAFQRIGRMLRDSLKELTGMSFPVVESADSRAGSTIILDQHAEGELEKEAYELEAGADRVLVSATHPQGLFYGCQTLLQMIGTRHTRITGEPDWCIPACKITDRPRYRWRGMLLDCCRHFMDKEFVKRYIDLLAYHKMNVLHWHLTEDQGWRIEIKKYPKLTEIGAWRNENGKRYGGYYTQEDIKEVVQYAANRFVQVVPEIELPGHSLAALAAYPQLSCTGGPFKVETRWGVFGDVYCAGNDATFDFLTDVLDEVMELFPSKYIHIGGDECPKTRWKKCPKCQARIEVEGLTDEHQLQSYFIKRIEDHVNSKGKRIIGWDEILEGGLAPNATVQSWRGMKGAIAAARAGHDVIASPTSNCYLDYAQARLPSEHTFGFLTLAQAYAFEPTPKDLTPARARHVLGIEGNLWSERAPQPRVDRQVFPRLCALSEVAWSQPQRRDYQSFLERMKTHYHRLDRLGVTYFFPPPVIKPHQTTFEDQMRLELVSPIGHGDIYYTLDGSRPTKAAQRYRGPITIKDNTVLNTIVVLADGRESDVATFHLRELRSLPSSPKPESGRPGLRCDYYERVFRVLPESFAKLEPAATTTASTIDLSPARRSRQFALAFHGWINIPRDGRYALFVDADAGARLWIDKELIVDNNGQDGPAQRHAPVVLQSGWHRIRLDYFQASWSAKLKVTMSGPGLDRGPIDGGTLWHE